MSEGFQNELGVMLSGGKKCLLVFVSIHQVMKAEKILKREGIEIDLIPIPREISSDCGVAVEVPLGLKKEALNFLNEQRLSILASYTKRQGKYEKGEEE